jgi:hypothetical protein
MAWQPRGPRVLFLVYLYTEREAAGGHGRRKTKVKAWFVRCFATDLSAIQTKPNQTKPNRPPWFVFLFVGLPAISRIPFVAYLSLFFLFFYSNI